MKWARGTWRVRPLATRSCALGRQKGLSRGRAGCRGDTVLQPREAQSGPPPPFGAIGVVQRGFWR